MKWRDTWLPLDAWRPSPGGQRASSDRSTDYSAGRFSLVPLLAGIAIGTPTTVVAFFIAYLAEWLQKVALGPTISTRSGMFPSAMVVIGVPLIDLMLKIGLAYVVPLIWSRMRHHSFYFGMVLSIFTSYGTCAGTVWLLAAGPSRWP